MRSGGGALCGRQFAVAAVERRYLRCDCVRCAGIVQHIVGGGESLLPIDLRRHDGADFGRREAAARDDASSLLRFGAVDDEHPIGERTEPRSFEQQWHDNHSVRFTPAFDLACDFSRDHRVQDAFESCPRRGIGKNEPPQRSAIEFPVALQDAGSKRCKDGVEAGLAGGRQPVRNLVGIDDFDAQRGERVRHRRLATAYTAGQPNDEAQEEPGR